MRSFINRSILFIDDFIMVSHWQAFVARFCCVLNSGSCNASDCTQHAAHVEDASPDVVEFCLPAPACFQD